MELSRFCTQADLAAVAEVYLPYALARKYPHARKEWRWQYVSLRKAPKD